MVNCDLESPEAKGLKARPPPKIAGRAGGKRSPQNINTLEGALRLLTSQADRGAEACRARRAVCIGTHDRSLTEDRSGLTSRSNRGAAAMSKRAVCTGTHDRTPNEVRSG